MHTRIYVLLPETIVLLIQQMNVKDFIINLFDFKGDWRNVEVVIDSKSKMLKTGEGIIIPAHTSHNVKANERFKMISTSIKSGYEEF